MSPPTTSQPGRQRDWLFRGWTSWAIPLALLALLAKSPSPPVREEWIEI